MSLGVAPAVDPPRRSPVVQRTSLLDRPAEGAYERLGRLALRMFGAPAVLITLLDDRREYFAGAHDAGARLGSIRDIPLHRLPGRQVIESGAAVVADDLRGATWAAGLVESVGPTACLGVPLLWDENLPVGSVCVVDAAPRPWTPDDLSALRDLATGFMLEARAQAEATMRATAEKIATVQSEHLHQLFEGAPEGIALLDPDDRVIRINGEFARIFGYAQEEVEGRFINDLIVPAPLRAEAAELTRQVAAGQPLRMELVRTRKDGTPLQVLISATPVVMDSEQIAVYAIYRDITEHTALLREREARFRSLIEHSSDVVAILSVGGAIDYVTESVETALGYSVDSLVGQNAFALIHPDDAPALLERFAQVSRGASCRGGLECQVLHDDGSWRTFEVRSNPLLDDPAVAGIAVSLRDVTDARDAKQTQRRLTTFLEATPDFVAIFDPRGRALSINSAFRQAAGLSPDQPLKDVTLTDLFPHRVTELLLHEGIPTATRTGIWAGETSLQRAGSEEIPVSQIILAHRSESGAVEFLSTLARDISEQKRAEDALRRSEEHFRSLIENALDVITILDARGTITFVSPSMQRVLGYAPEELLGTSIFSLVHPEERGEMETVFGQILGQEHKHLEPGEFRLRRKDGGWRVLESVSENLLAEPTVQGIVVNSRDVTDRKSAEDALRQSQEQLLQAQKMEAVGRLAGGVAHDFNNLLTAIKGFTELLLLDFDTRDPRYPYAHEIQSAANRAAALTRQLLAFSRKQVLQPRVMDLNASVNEMERMLQRLIGEDVELRTSLSPDLGRIKADPGQVEQIVMNLVVNARDAMPSGGHLAIRTLTSRATDEQMQRHSVPGGEYVVLAVRDTGCGMSREVQQKIFEPFFTTKGAGKGTGLGLATVYGIVQQSEGFIEVESEVGRGTEFRVFLPRVLESVPEVVRPAPTGSVQGSETVLLVEDEQAVRVLVRRVLDRMGYTVLEADSGASALALLQQHPRPVDLLLTDVVMPGMSGRELADRLCPLNPQLRVLYMSGYTDEAISHHGVLDEGIALLEKPFTPDILLRKLREVLDAPIGAGAR